MFCCEFPNLAALMPWPRALTGPRRLVLKHEMSWHVKPASSVQTEVVVLSLTATSALLPRTFTPLESAPAGRIQRLD